MNQRIFCGVLALVLVSALAGSAHAQITPYSQDFEGLDPLDLGALTGDGWLVFAAVSHPDFFYTYGPFGAPNGDPVGPNGELGFSLIVTGEGGPPQGNNQLSTFSDYVNGNHSDGTGALLETNVFQEWVVAAEDVGTTWTFTFDAKLGDLAPPSTALGFIKTVDPNTGFGLSNFFQVPTDNISDTDWQTFQLSIPIDATVAPGGTGPLGHFLQIGFLTTASNNGPSTVFYDNINFSSEPKVPTMGDTARIVLLVLLGLTVAAMIGRTAWRRASAS